MKTTRTFILYFVFGPVLLTACENKSSHEREGTTLEDSLIYLIDISTYNNYQLGNLIIKLNGYQPKIIGIEFGIEKSLDWEADSLLRNAIRSSGNVILSADINENGIIKRDSDYFREFARSEGLLSYVFNENSTAIELVPLYQNDTEQIFGFPYAIMFEIKPSRSEFLKLNVNERIKIRNHNQAQSKSIIILDPSFEIPANIKDKIIILGELYPSEEYFLPSLNVESERVKTSLPVITANILIEMLLKWE